MSVLPDSATFASFFAVLAIAFAFTLLLGINLSRVRTTILLGVQDSNLWSRILRAPFRRIKSYAEIYVDALGTPKHDDHSILFCCSHGNIRSFLVAIIRDFLIPEIHVPLTLWNRFLYRNNPYVRVWWSPISVLVHAIRITLIPLWISLVVCILVGLVFWDVVSICSHFFSEAN
jgi:hypothetical protein